MEKRLHDPPGEVRETVLSEDIPRAQEHAEERTDDLFVPVGEQVDGITLNRDDVDGPQAIDEIESLCMECGENGKTRLLLTKIPHFREIVIMSFYCEHCHFSNSEVQAAGEIQEKGARYTLKLEQLSDLQRQIVKSDTAIFRIETLDLEVPAGRGRISNIEGVIGEILNDLGKDQSRRQQKEPALYERMEEILGTIARILSGERFPCTISLDDPAGNSWIEPSSSDAFRNYSRAPYARTSEQNSNLGLSGDADRAEPGEEGSPTRQAVRRKPENNSMEGVDILEGQTYNLPCHCPGCAREASMNLQMVNIPYFKEVIVSAVVCQHCGYRTNDVKTGGEVPTHGKRIWLDVEGPIDLRRDILKSETCCLKIPEFNVEVQPGTMGGRFTTVEGLLTQIRDDLHGSIFDVGDVDGLASDTMPIEQKVAWATFFSKLSKAIAGETKYTILMEDPLDNSYVQSLTAPAPDPQIRKEEYVRTEEEDDELGLADMRTQLNTDGKYTKEAAHQTEQSKKVDMAAIHESTIKFSTETTKDKVSKGKITEPSHKPLQTEMHPPCSTPHPTEDDSPVSFIVDLSVANANVR